MRSWSFVPSFGTIPCANHGRPSPPFSHPHLRITNPGAASGSTGSLFLCPSASPIASRCARLGNRPGPRSWMAPSIGGMTTLTDVHRPCFPTPSFPLGRAGRLRLCPFLSPPTAIATAGPAPPAVANQAKAKHVRLLCVLPDLSFALARRSTRHTYHGTQTHWQGATTVAVCLAVCVALSPASHSGGSGCGGLGRPTDRPRALARGNQGQTHLCRLRPSPDLLVRPIVCISMPLTRTREPRPTRSASCPTASRPRHGCPPCCQKRMAVSRETWSELPHATRSGWQLAGGPAAARFVHPAVDQKRKRIERSASASRSCPLRSQRGE